MMKFIPPSSVTERTLNIVVADDEKWMIAYYKECLTKLGHRIIAVGNNGQELLKLTKLHKPDLVITDIKMPIMDGLDAAEKIYDDTFIPVIIVSGFHDNQTLIAAENRHIHYYLTKPVRIDDLKLAITITMDKCKEFNLMNICTNDKLVIQEAKTALMKKAKIKEPEATKKLQRMASKNKQKLIDVARTILMFEQVN